MDELEMVSLIEMLVKERCQWAELKARVIQLYILVK